MDDLDKLTERLTIPQKMALAKCIVAILQADDARRQAHQTPGEVVFARPVADMFKRGGEG